MLLEKQVEKALKVLGQGQKGSARHFAMERSLIVLWSMYRGWTDTITAQKLGVHASTVARYRQQFIKDAGAIFRCPVLHKRLKGKDPLWICQFCGEEMRGAEVAAREHVASHVLSPDIIALYGVGL